MGEETLGPEESAVSGHAMRAWVEAHPRIQFSDLVMAQFAVRRALVRDAPDDVRVQDLERDLQWLWHQFEAVEGRIILSTFAVSFAGGVAVTERNSPWRPRELFEKRTTLKLHRSIQHPGVVPAALVTAFSRGDAVAVRAAEVLWPSSARVVLQLVHSAQSHLLSVMDAAGTDLPRLGEWQRRRSPVEEAEA
jgi:hypothetical protein